MAGEVPSRLVSGAFFGLLQENVSLVTMELITYIMVFVTALHVQSSGKRNAIILVASFVQTLLIELVFLSAKRWHAEALFMLIPGQLPLFFAVLHSMLYYAAFVATSRLRIDILVQPLAMACLTLLLTFPTEVVGAKFLWWTWHDTDPLVDERLYGVPLHMCFLHFFFGYAFLLIHHLLDDTLFQSDYYEEERKKREWSYTFIQPIFSTLAAAMLLVLAYETPVYLLHIHPQAWMMVLLSCSLVFCWIADRDRDDSKVQRSLAPVDAYDSDWLYPTIDHAVNQLVFIYTFILSGLVLFANPAEVISLGRHQPLGNCLETEIFMSVVGKEHVRKPYLCVHEFDEEFNLCNYPIDQLRFTSNEYMVCGKGYQSFATYLVIILASALVLNLAFAQTLKRPKDTIEVPKESKAK